MSVNRLLSEYHNDGSFAMLIATRLYIRYTHIWSANGVQQGDPLGPFLFALVLHPLVHKIRDGYKLRLHAWYLDDETVIGDSEEVARVLDIIKVSGLAVSRDADYISGMAMRRAANAVDLMSLLL
ncbi:putative reverse transcriptase domain-containing protein [Tanacetum coccineum]